MTALHSKFRLIVLGVAQDAGYPQAGCRNDCCLPAWNDHRLRRLPCCVAVVDTDSHRCWLMDCTPRFPEQFHALEKIVATPQLAGIFLTHAHIGHYTGLIYLGREAMDAKGVPVYAMPRMESFLRNNAPWSQLVDHDNIALHPLSDGQANDIAPGLSITPYTVPHRGEFSETVGYAIRGQNRSVLYLTDIDRWDKWESGIVSSLATFDIAYLDGTFYSGDELPGRDMTQIPHPTIVDSIERFASLPTDQRSKIRFLHFNHTNPTLHGNSDAAQAIRAAGYEITEQGEVFAL